MSEIPYSSIGVPPEHIEKVSPEAPKKIRLAVAKGLLPLPPSALIPMVFVLCNDAHPKIAAAARETLSTMPSATVSTNINRQTHPKLLEFLAESRPADEELMAQILRYQDTNDRTACLIAARASAALVERIAQNQERLLITPEIYLHLRENEHTTQAILDRVEAFLRMNHCLPEVPAPEPPAAAEPAADAPAEESLTPEQLEALRVQAEVEAALLGLPSPSTNEHVKAQLSLEMFDLDGPGGGGADANMLGEFRFDFSDDFGGGSFNLTDDPDENRSHEDAAEERQNLTQYLASLSPGRKIKLAYKGNIEVRKILITDRNKTVASAVVRSGRCGERELENIAGNRNLDTEVLRELTLIRDAMRKYQIRVLLVNNPKCPTPVALSIVNQLQRRDLEALARNKNVSGVVSSVALRKVNAIKQAESGGKR